MVTFRPKPQSEADVPADSAVVESRDRGGNAAAEDPDALSTTGTGDTDEFVGRVAGDDLGYSGETGAERRQAAPEE